MDNIFAKPKQTAQDIAKKIAKSARNEIVEYSKSATAQFTGQETGQPSPIVEAMRQGTENVTETVHEGIHSDEKRKLDYLERELEALQRKSKLEAEQTKMQEVTGAREQKPVIVLQEPTSRRGRQMMGGKRQAEKKQTRMETGKQVSG